MSSKTSAESLRERITAFVDDHWQGIAAAAYDQYMKKGRGCLILEPADLEIGKMTYVAFDELEAYGELMKDQGPTLWAGLKRHGDNINCLLNYDPETQVTIVVATGVSVTPPFDVVYSERITPPEAYNRQAGYVISDEKASSNEARIWVN